MYQLIKPFPPQTESSCIKRITDNTFIPFDPGNISYQEYLAWLAEGNEPEPADEPLSGIDALETRIQALEV